MKSSTTVKLLIILSFVVGYFFENILKSTIEIIQNPEWVGALATLFSVPISTYFVLIQLKKGDKDRHYDARTFFVISWPNKNKVEEVKKNGSFIMHPKNMGVFSLEKLPKDNEHTFFL